MGLEGPKLSSLETQVEVEPSLTEGDLPLVTLKLEVQRRESEQYLAISFFSPSLLEHLPLSSPTQAQL